MSFRAAAPGPGPLSPRTPWRSVAALAAASLAFAQPAGAGGIAASPVLVPLGALETAEGVALAREAVALALREAGPREHAPDLVPLGRTAAGGGVIHVAFAEAYGGVPVFRGRHVVAVRPDGRVLAVILGETLAGGAPGPFLVSAREAVALADAALGAKAATQAAASDSEALADVRAGIGAPLAVDLPAGREPALAAPVVVADGPWSAWRVDLQHPDDASRTSAVLIDATTGAILGVMGVTREAAATGRAFPRGADFPSELRTFTDADSALDPASPAGWVAVDATEGNNLFVEEDRAGDQLTTRGPMTVGTGSPLRFDFPFTGVPAADLDAAITNAFWATNEAHDRLHRLGFNEASGACQTENYGRGGASGDRTRVFVQYAAGASATAVRNQNTATTSLDGVGGTLTFGLWDRSGSVRDGALDTGLVFHEYVHLAVTRLAGGDPTCDDGTHPSGLAEGWADYFAASWTGDPVIGAWVSGDSTKGLRTVSLAQNRYSLANFCYILGDYCNRNENGEIWAGALWELRSAYVQAFGPDEGRERCDRLVLEGMRYTPCRATFVQARTGIVLADAALTGGADHCLIWSAFAARGLGVDAAAAGPSDARPFPSFQVPPSCAGGATLAFDRPRYGLDAEARLTVTDATAGAAARVVRVTSSSGDAEDVTAAGPSPVRSAVISVRPGPPLAGDGILQAADGDALSAACGACPGAPQAAASVSSALAVSILGHRVTSGSCDADAVADFPYPELPGLLDAGEVATLTLTLGNGETFPLDDVRVRITDDHPGVTLLPQGEISLARVPPGHAQPWPFVVVLRAIADPSPSVRPGDVMVVTADVTARGVSGRAQATVDLAADYAVDRAVSSWGGPETFEASSPSVNAWTHAPAYGRPADLWARRACGDGGGTAMAYAGAGCANYADTPSAATLVSPPLVDVSGGVKVVHATGLSWRNEVGLGRDPRSLYCDSEMVLLYLTDDPARPPYANPIGDRNNATQYWAQWTAFPDERNTNGWATGAPRTPVGNNTLAGRRLDQVRLYWVFMTDVYNPSNSGGCRLSDPDAVGLGYRLDNVSFTYDAARTVPQADLTCSRTCAVRASLSVAAPADGRRCPGDPVRLSGEASEAHGCAGGQLEYRFTGPGLDTGYTTSPTAVAAAAMGATWTLRVRCAADTGCTETVAVADPTLEDSQAGRVWPDSLTVRHAAGDAVLRWEGTRSPVAYAVFAGAADPADPAARLDVLARLSANPPEDALRRGSADALWYRDPSDPPAARGRATYFRVLGRSPCLGTALDR